MSDAVVAGLFTLAGAFILLAYQFWRDRQQRIEAEKTEKISRRMAIISDLVSNRFVLTETRASARGIYYFNRALSSIPIEFIDNKAVIDQYRKIGDEFNSEKFHRMIIAMIQSTRESAGHIDVHLLEHVPSSRLNVPECAVSVNFNTGDSENGP